MASSSFFLLPLALVASLSFLGRHFTFAGVICEDLPQNLCAFTVSSASKRCVLESYRHGNTGTEYRCETSEVVVDQIADHIETDQCIKACGVDRHSVGISSDALLETNFRNKLCSQDCYTNCPNIVDLYFNLAAGEGVFLPNLCHASGSNPHRAMAERLSSSSTAALAPVSVHEASASTAPAPAPMAST